MNSMMAGEATPSFILGEGEVFGVVQNQVLKTASGVERQSAHSKEATSKAKAAPIGAKGKVNFEKRQINPRKSNFVVGGGKMTSINNTMASIQSFADAEIEINDVTKVKLALGGLKSDQEGSSSTLNNRASGAGTQPDRPKTQLSSGMIRDGSESDFRRQQTNQIWAWRSKDSYHRKLVQRRREEAKELEKAESCLKKGDILGVPRSRILGMAVIE